MNMWNSAAKGFCAAKKTNYQKIQVVQSNQLILLTNIFCKTTGKKKINPRIHFHSNILLFYNHPQPLLRVSLR